MRLHLSKSQHYVIDVIRTIETSINSNPTFQSKAIFKLNVSAMFE